MHCGATYPALRAAPNAIEEITVRMRKRLKAAPFQSISQIAEKFNF